ncbi:MAG: flagellar basal-body rod protein FlgF [Methylophilaceae bacterium 17-44-8]|jgi:flagellar basal-body rod protein FlgF|nr:MAG: flagellar basal-body rod protein FlgF [Methylophilales bacterium 28-44-11]OYZ08768.1 MAG: flagellar basal-body rod protein FlgF [Methylophilales bacterium 16-45-7]OZA05443.1 MAG: flagellar basal-body rod protein FlgF [Methylophilaceae bacterium 17-44-8]
MDRMIYTAMTGAKHILEQQATTAHNLANATSTGFKAQVDSFRAVPIIGQGLPTRAFVVDATVGADFNSGAIEQTGRDLDVAVQGDGWLVVQRPNGSEGYTRNGSLKVNENGVLQTANGLTVMGDGGPISIPPDVTISIGKDGTISSVMNNTMPGPTSVIGRLKLVNPDPANLKRSEEGVFITKNGAQPEADANVSVVGGALESSNVNVVDAMVSMISLARQFEMQMKLVQSAENNANKASQLFNMS